MVATIFVLLLILVGFVLIVRSEGWLRAIMLQRVPLLALLFLVALPLFGVGSELFGNLFVVSRKTDVAALTVLGLASAWLSTFALLVNWEYAPRRFATVGGVSVAGAKTRHGSLSRRASGRLWELSPVARVLLSSVFALPLLLTIAVKVEAPLTPPRAALPMLVGVGIALFLLWLTLLVRSFVVARFKDVLDVHLAPWLRRLPKALWEGYIDDPQAAQLRILPGHVSATAMFVVFLLLYGVISELFPGYHQTRALAPLAYALAGFLLVVSFLAGASFFLDRFRVPLVLAMGLWAFLSTGVHGDHVFRLHGRAPAAPPLVLPTPGQSIEPWLAAEEAESPGRKPTLVVVAASGGGIQSAAWATRVLTWFEAAMGEEFARSVRFASSASGGSVGLAIWLEGRRLLPGTPEGDCGRWQRTREAASRSSLAAVSWGIMARDLRRGIVPLPSTRPFNDRAWALEEAWRRSFLDKSCASEGEPRLDGKFSDWVAEVRAGKLPGVAFNTFSVDTGERVLLNSVEVPGPYGSRARSVWGIFNQGKGEAEAIDLEIMTAARLSASFPYVSPQPIAAWNGDDGGAGKLPKNHFADGGYFDNSGILTATDWIRSLLAEDGGRYRERLGRIVLLELRAFARGTELAENKRGLECKLAPEPLGDDVDPQSPGVYAAFGPVLGLTAQRTGSQIARAQAELCLLHDSYRKLERLVVAPKLERSNLSWHLTDDDRELMDGLCDALLGEGPEGKPAKRLAGWLGATLDPNICKRNAASSPPAS